MPGGVAPRSSATRRRHATANYCKRKSFTNASLTNKPQRSESLIWVGSLTVNQRVTFEIDVDNGWENDDASMKGCYTIVNVD